ncbi:uracil phosphoribosyltransferase [Bacteroidia bacterium]|nr:uracil phosphoribosyltransferase [Bacteroidia bacterium]
MTNSLEKSNSLFNYFISEIRNKDVQNDRMRFRTNLKRIGEVFAYEISKTLNYSEKDIVTPLGVKKMLMPEEHIVVASVLRAGLPLHDGILNYFDYADNAFITAYRKHDNAGNIDIKMDYLACPDINNSILILCDPMLATGASILQAYNALLKTGTPKKIHIVSAIASQKAVDFIQKNINKNTDLWLGGVDSELTPQSYIVPGLGDAGDLAFGPKLQN